MKERERRLGLPPWLREEDPEGIVMSARIRLARNVAEAAFPGWAGNEESVRLCRRLLPLLQAVPPLTGGVLLSMEEVGPLERQMLHERHLISNELTGKGEGSAVLVSPDESVSVMINEEDHLRIQALVSGKDLMALWTVVDALDTRIEERIPYAASPKLGYLTACPSNVGTGLRASVMLHLPGLRLAGDAEKVVKGLAKLGLAVRGLLGEGTDAYGGMYQISNQMTLGQGEPVIIAHLLTIVDEVIGHERRARLRLAETRPGLLKDRVMRAVALLTHARLMTAEEALDLLSGIRLGLTLGWIKHLGWPELDELFLLVQPAHLQKQAGRSLVPEERDAFRADLLRKRMAGVEWV
jgi:protein arginine kinase